MGVNTSDAITQANIHQMVRQVLAVGRLLAEAERWQGVLQETSEISPTDEVGLKRERKVRHAIRIRRATSK